MGKRVLTLLVAAIIIIGAAQLEALAADTQAVYRWNLAVVSSKTDDKAAFEYYKRENKCDDKEIGNLASSIIAGKKSEYEKIKAVHDWVAGNIWYDKDAVSAPQVSAIWPPDIIKSKRGICYVYARLTAALLIEAGIPAKVVTGLSLGASGSPTDFYDISSTNATHAWNEAYADGRWIILDTTWDSMNRYENGLYSKRTAHTDKHFDISLQDLSKTHRYLDYTEYGIFEGFLVDCSTYELKYIYDWYTKDTFTEITIPYGVKSIGNSAINAYANLKYVVIPNSVVRVEDYAISECPNLSAIIVPDSVTHIGEDALGRKLLNPYLKIYGNAGSYAQAYAKNNSITFVVGTPPSPFASPSPWAADRVDAAVAQDLVPVPLQSQYALSITRAEYCALAVRLYEKHTGKVITKRRSFYDTKDANVEKMAGIGVVSGVGDNMFDPTAELTREQAAVMLARLSEAFGKPLPKQTAAFNDSAAISDWAFESVGQVQAAGIMSGTGDNAFAPKDPYTREQSIVTIMRLFDFANG